MNKSGAFFHSAFLFGKRKRRKFCKYRIIFVFFYPNIETKFVIQKKEDL